MDLPFVESLHGFFFLKSQEMLYMSLAHIWHSDFCDVWMSNTWTDGFHEWGVFAFYHSNGNSSFSFDANPVVRQPWIFFPKPRRNASIATIPKKQITVLRGQTVPNVGLWCWPCCMVPVWQMNTNDSLSSSKLCYYMSNLRSIKKVLAGFKKPGKYDQEGTVLRSLSIG